MVKIRGCFEGQLSEPNATFGGDRALEVVRQIEADAVAGTFAQLPMAPFEGRWAHGQSALVAGKVLDERRDDRWCFELGLADDLFPVERGGLQHLIGLLAGDLFTMKIAGLALSRWEVTEVDLGELRETARISFAKTRHTIAKIRERFQLEHCQPLLACSFKPRMGLTPEAFEELSLGILEAGFHLVEPDTRNIGLEPQFQVNLAMKAQRLRTPHTTCFAPNLTGPADSAMQILHNLRDEGVCEPIVVKVDGGLDGLTTCQALKRTGIETLITCYPLLREQLAHRVPKVAFVDMLVSSGADIIYPGGRPDVGAAVRNLGANPKDAVWKSSLDYRMFCEEGYAMPTIAGGVYAGQLHAFYELVGPQVAYFLGGAVALHKDGPVKGAELCARILQAACTEHERNPTGAWRTKLPDRLIEEVEAAYDLQGVDSNLLGYVRPDEIASVSSGFEPWQK